MKSEMTEKEARTAVDARLFRDQGALSDRYWEAIKETLCLEFAPEPKLPERLDMVSGHAMAHGWSAWQESERNDCPFDPLAVSLAAVARYNAYPKLWKAARAAVDAWGKQGVLGAMDNLAAELEKGPKP